MTNKLRIFGIIIESASTNIISLGNEHALLSSATLDRFSHASENASKASSNKIITIALAFD